VRWTSLMSTALVLLSVSPSGLSPAAPMSEGFWTGLLVTVGEVTATTATLWVKGDRRGLVAAKYQADDHGPVHEVGIALDPRADLTGRVALARLEPRTRYVYELDHDGERVTGSFRTAPRPATGVAARVLWSGDLGGANHCRDVEDGYRIFEAMTERHADLFLFIGDTIYADQTCGRTPHARGSSFVAESIGEFHAKYRYNRADATLQRLFRTTPVEAIWDDHEVRNNFAGPMEPLMPVGRQAFLDYWPVSGAADEPSRLYRRLRWGRHLEVFVLDTRQYRSPNEVPDGPAKSMLGAAQRAWLLDGLARSDATWKVIVSSVPLGMFTGGAFSDSWSGANVLGFPRKGNGFVHERSAILDAIHRGGVKNLVVLSGDVHHAELIRHEPIPGFVLHEFVAGPLAARQGFRRFLDRSLNSQSLGSLGWANNFGELVADGDRLTVRIIDTAGTPRVSLRVGVAPTVLEAQAEVHAVHPESGETR